MDNKKRKYKVVTDNGSFISTSRNSKEHLKNHGGNQCFVYTLGGKLVSRACRDENDHIHNAYF